MNKTILCAVITSFLLAGCTSKEQDRQIKAFWQQQVVSAFAQRAGMKPLPVAQPPEDYILPLQEQEEKEIAPLQQEPLPVLVVQPAEQSVTQDSFSYALPPQKPATPQRAQLQAILFIHSDSPLCQQLKADNWDTKFQQKYAGKIRLITYDMKNPLSREPLRLAMRKYKMPSLTVPILFVGDAGIQGYPFNGVEEAVQKILKNPKHVPASTSNTARQRKQPAQFMEIVMEDTRIPKINTRASAKDNRAMQLALDTVRNNNEAILADIKMMFGNETQAEAFAIVSSTERLLQDKALSSPNYQTYLSTQRTLLSIQEKNLNQLMRKNAKNIRAIRG